MRDTLVGQYRITGHLVCGMSALYTAEHVLLGRPAAVKLLLPAQSSRRDSVDRLFQEARATAAIQHPSIVEIYDFGWHTDGTPYLVMELLRGEDLHARLRRGRMTPARATMIARQIAGALAAAHDKSIVHGALTPGKVFLVPDTEAMGGERIKVLGFGIAKVPDGSQAHVTRTDCIVGRPRYMAPEQLRGLPVDHRTDLYALGCIMFELYSGQPPFSGRTEDVLAAHLTLQPPSLTGISDLSPELATVIQRLLTKNRDQRIQSAGELVQAIDAATGFRYRTSKLEPLPDDAPPLPATLPPDASTRMPRLPERRASLLLSALVFAAGARGLLLEVETPPRSPAVVRAAVPTRSQSPQNPPAVPVRVSLPASAAEPAPRPPAAVPAVTTANLVEMYAEVGQQLKALRHDRGAGVTADLWPPYLSIRINEVIADPDRREAASALLYRLRDQIVERSR